MVAAKTANMKCSTAPGVILSVQKVKFCLTLKKLEAWHNICSNDEIKQRHVYADRATRIAD